MTERLTIRAAALDDVPRLTHLLGGVGQPVSDSAVRAALTVMRQDSRHMVAVAERGGQVLGLVALAMQFSLAVGGWVAVVDVLVVRAERPGGGVGESMLQYAKAMAADRGAVSLEVHVADGCRRDAEPFLAAVGLEDGGGRTFRWSAPVARRHGSPRRDAAASLELHRGVTRAQRSDGRVAAT